ncbi:MAG TPA: DUF2971 domain-containing protein [Saprospiraceae bacterium]|nr:DUF2971 domain-containing protein [Saprospiraceae bacterium]
MEFLHNHEFELNLEKGAFFWKYIDVVKLLFLVTRKKLFFNRLDQFEDPLEGMTDEDQANLHTWGGMPEPEKNPALPEEVRIALPQLKKSNLDKIDKQTLASQKMQFANCWFHGKGESLAMWNLYSNSQGVALKVDPQKLFTYIKQKVCEIDHESNFDVVTYGFVEYRPITPYDFLNRSSLKHIFNTYKKDLSYSHENEFRFTAVLKQDKVDDSIFGFELPFEDILSEIEIIGHPKQPGWIREILNENIKANKINNKIIPSKIKLR